MFTVDYVNRDVKGEGVEPRYMGISPVAAIPRVLGETGLTKEDVDVFEVCVQESMIDEAR